MTEEQFETAFYRVQKYNRKNDKTRDKCCRKIYKRKFSIIIYDI
ncbi:hypothetical protein [Tissierella sp. P1]|uniref:Uncharacterized protein n=1 Tax=Tissierella carlieri TaxID=689904 RepID=A0ABT1S4S9_9FIRM|nr:hypothetical protein [Tissierella sp. P1]MCQ4921469.1 hypothetical protein [Tissierella carlieri]MDU5081607.1 hypothetical protein [Bacillota bacterium]